MAIPGVSESAGWLPPVMVMNLFARVVIDVARGKKYYHDTLATMAPIQHVCD